MMLTTIIDTPLLTIGDSFGNDSNSNVQEEAYHMKDPDYWSDLEDTESDVSEADSSISQSDDEVSDSAALSFARALNSARMLADFFDVTFMVGFDLVPVCGVKAMLSSQSR
jgi:hypothetical protein